jgi:hypothetical protein
MNPVDFTFFSVNTVQIDGTSSDTRTGNLFGPIGGEFGVLQSADILGTPVRNTSIVDPDLCASGRSRWCRANWCARRGLS